MRRLIVPVVALGLAACQAKPVMPAGGGKPATAAPASPAARVPVPKAALLQKPTTPSTTLSGIVALDAGYLITNDGGSIISNDGNSIVAQGGGNIVATGGGNIVATGGGNVVAVARGALIGNDGASLITNDGASVLASAAGNVIVGDADAVLASDGAAKRRALLEAPATAPELPAAGMWLRAISLKDGKALPLGVDGAGKPVYVVATDAKGAFTIYLPQEVAENVRVVASVPHAKDAHLTYNHVLPPKPAMDLRLDEGHALVSDYLLGTVEDRILEALGGGDPNSAKAFTSSAPAALQPLLAQLRADAKAAGFDAMGAAQRHRLVAHIAQDTLSAVGLNGGTETNGFAADTLARVKASLDLITARAAALPPAELEALRTRPWAIAANRVQALKGKPPVAISKATDVASLVAQAYVGSVDRVRQHQLAAAMADLGLEQARYEELNAVTEQISQVLIANLVQVGDGLTTSVGAAAAQQGQLPASPTPAPEPEPPLPQPGGVGLVSTIAGLGTVGDSDAPTGLAAGITLPLAASVDDATHKLYLAEDYGVIRVVDLADPAHPMSTLAGKEQANQTVDGPAAEARFGSIRALRVVGTKLYLAEVGRVPGGGALAPGGVIRMVDLADPAHPVTTVAGKLGEGGHAVGPGPQARFDLPVALAADHAGDLYVSDFNQHVVLKLDLHGGQNAVSVYAGVPEPKTRAAGFDGPAKQVELLAPAGITFDAKDALVLSDSRWVRRLGADGILRVVAGGGESSDRDGFWLDATLAVPAGLAPLPDGDVLVAENLGQRVRRLRFTADGRAAVVWTVAGPPDGQDPKGVSDGQGPLARFNVFYDVATDAAGTAYVPEFGAHRIRQITF